MALLNVVLPSGAALEASLAPFADGHRLLKVVSKELESVKFSLDAKVSKLAELDGEGLNTIKSAILRLLGSDAVEQALWPCFARATWNKQKITPALFEDETPRGDFLAAAKEVLVYNLSPFFSSLGSWFSTPSQNPVAFPLSASTLTSP